MTSPLWRWPRNRRWEPLSRQHRVNTADLWFHSLHKSNSAYNEGMTRYPPRHSLLAVIAVLCCAPTSSAQVPQPVVEGQSHYVTNVFPFLETFCVDCHSGEAAEAGIALDQFQDGSDIQNRYDLWEKVHRMITERQMPPEDADQPNAEQLMQIRYALEIELASFDCTSEKHPGRVTLRRLNRVEYQNTIRDLLGIQFDVMQDFPADDVGYGFDNIGDVLTIPPALFEKYFQAAESIAAQAFADEQARQRILVHTTEVDEERIAVAQRNIREFAERAWRRPLTDAEANELFELMRTAWENDSPIEEIFQTVVTAILVNPHFLFRVEDDPAMDDADGIRELDDFELATRLSYFLWSSMPDAKLFELAAQGQLQDSDVLATQAHRMLADPKSHALVENFAGQWLQLRDIARLTPDQEKFPQFNHKLRSAMRRETELFFENLIRENRSLLEILNADYTYVNGELAKHYGIDGIKGDNFQRVDLPPQRRGMLTQASILMLTSNPGRTSPVKRGKWILENILSEPPPPPPPDVPELEEGLETLGTLREQMEQHRSNPSCAACHRKMDALGFGLENFDAIGGWRDQDGRFEIDATGELPGGKNFDGASELMQILVEEKKTQFSETVAKKMLTYALGRGLSSYDRCTINSIVAAMEEDEYRFESLVKAIVTSDPFRLRERRRTE